MVLRCNPTANDPSQTIDKLRSTHPLVHTDVRGKLLQLCKFGLVLHHSHGALGETQELLHHLILNVPREEPLSENREKLIPSNIHPVLKDGAQRRCPPHVSSVLKSKGSQVYLVLIRATYSSENLLSLTNLALRHIGTALPLKGRRPHPAKPLHHGHAITTILLHCSLLIRRSCVAVLSLKSNKSLRLHMHSLHQSRERLKETSKLRWR